MTLMKATVRGLVGACPLTLIHETARRFIPDAPRMDVLGMRAIAESLRGAGREPPAGERLHAAALAGDILANSLYYSLAGAGRAEDALLRAAALGAAAGVGAVVLPEPLGLGGEASGRTTATKAMTVGWYLAGGLAAAVTYQLLTKQGVAERKNKVELIYHRVLRGGRREAWGRQGACARSAGTRCRRSR